MEFLVEVFQDVKEKRESWVLLVWMDCQGLKVSKENKEYLDILERKVNVVSLEIVVNQELTG